MSGLKYQEPFLLLIVGLVLINGLTAVSMATGEIAYPVLAMSVLLTLILIGIHIFIRHAGHMGDPLLFPIAALMSAIGLIMVFRLKPNLFFFQLSWIIIGLILYIVAVLYGWRIQALSDYKYIWGLIGISLLLVTSLFGVEIGGNKNWLVFGPLRFQPSEFAKLFIILFLAAYLNERHEVLTFATKSYGPFTIPHPRFISPLLAIWGVTMLMLIFQRDLGATLLFFGTTVLMTYIASGRNSYIIWGGILFLLGVLLVYNFYPHVNSRIQVWINPWADPAGKAYQITQALFALGTGGILGSGLNYGFPELIPEVHTDFVFAAIGEELGLIGTAAVIILYILLVYRSFRIAMVTAEYFCSFLAAGLSVFFALQVVVIIGGVTKFLPLTGITMPFVSYGGSSIVANFISLGILMALSEKRSANES